MKAYFSICLKQCNTLRNIFIVGLSNYSMKILLGKPPGCSSFLFVYIRVMATYKATKCTFPGSLKGLPRCFSVVECQKSSLGQLDFKSAHQVFDWEKKPTFKPKLACA